MKKTRHKRRLEQEHFYTRKALRENKKKQKPS